MKTKKIILAAISIITLSFLLNSCYTPSPLYGTWANNDQNKITFIADGTYTAKIAGENKEGTWQTIDNVLVISFDGGNTSITEWEIRGNILYLKDFKVSSDPIQLILYKIAR